ncbi:LysR family transcriptional regulator [Variovorax paradoxus]|nr:LysR family transcriptional regulator [Variovorax paradoxus]
MIATTNSIIKRLRGNYIDLLLALDGHGSLRKAAQQVSLSQPAATKALNEIEYMIGTKLFTRSPRGIVANEFGHCVIRHARRLRFDVGDLREELVSLTRGGGGSLAVGAIMEALPAWVAPVLEEMKEFQSDVIVQVWEDHSVRLLEMLDQRLLDLVICRVNASMRPDLYDFTPLADEELCFVVDGRHDLARKPSVQFADIAFNAWVVPPARLTTRMLLEQVFEEHGFKFPTYAVECSSTFATLCLIRSAKGTVAILPKSVANVFAPFGLIGILPIHFGRSSAPYGIVTRRGSALSQRAQMFMDLCKKRQACAEDLDSMTPRTT